MMNTYKTNEVAKYFKVHPNTVRKYEELGLISKAYRKENGYRVFTQLHIDQFNLARLALDIEILQNGLRKKAIHIVKLSARCEFEQAIKRTDEYLRDVDTEIANANDAVTIVQELLSGNRRENSCSLKRKEVSLLLGITMDTLRNWEMNGLLKVKRRENGYRVYTNDDILRLKIIRSLKCANYSLSAILRMLNALDKEQGLVTHTVDIETVLNTPSEQEDITSVCDKLIISLQDAKKNAMKMKGLLLNMKEKYGEKYILEQ